jgi:hypothetical protein
MRGYPRREGQTTIGLFGPDTSSSWLNLVERWFGEITRKRIRRGLLKPVTLKSTKVGKA